MIEPAIKLLALLLGAIVAQIVVVAYPVFSVVLVVSVVICVGIWKWHCSVQSALNIRSKKNE